MGFQTFIQPMKMGTKTKIKTFFEKNRNIYFPDIPSDSHILLEANGTNK